MIDICCHLIVCACCFDADETNRRISHNWSHLCSTNVYGSFRKVDRIKCSMLLLVFNWETFIIIIIWRKKRWNIVCPMYIVSGNDNRLVFDRSSTFKLHEIEQNNRNLSFNACMMPAFVDMWPMNINLTAINIAIRGTSYFIPDKMLIFVWLNNSNGQFSSVVNVWRSNCVS